MPDYNVFLDPDTIGRRIREIRRSKELTIIQLAEKVGFATGKLSNIEKGRRLKLPLEELQQIAIALEEPIESFLDADPETMLSNFGNIKDKISMASHRLSSGLIRDLSKTLQEIENDISRFSFKGLEIYIYFLWAEYFKAQNEQDKSMQYYKFTLLSDVSDQETIDLKLRSYNALSSLLFSQNNIRDAIEVLLDAISFLGKIESFTNLDVFNLHYNLSILYIHKGYLDLAESHAMECLDLTVARNDELYNHAKFLLAITCLLKNRYDQSKVYLFDSIKWFQRQKDISSLVRSLSLIFKLYRLDSSLFIPGFYKKSHAQEFLELEVPECAIPEKIKCIHCLIDVALEEKDYVFAKVLIERCKSFASDTKRYKISYNTFALEARLLRETNKRKNRQMQALETALSYFDENENSKERAVLYYELGVLSEKSDDSLLNKSAELFYEYYKDELRHQDCIRSSLPALRY